MTGGGAFLVISSGVGLSCSQQLYKMANPSGHTSLVLCAFISVLSVALGSSCDSGGMGDPTLTLNTNVFMIGDEKREFLTEASKVVSAVLGKPESYVAICVNDDLAIMWGGSSDPAALGCLYSIGGITQANNGAITKQISALLTKFGIAPDRVYINFFDVPRENCGWNEQTFADILGSSPKPGTKAPTAAAPVAVVPSAAARPPPAERPPPAASVPKPDSALPKLDSPLTDDGGAHREAAKDAMAKRDRLAAEAEARRVAKKDKVKRIKLIRGE